MCVCGLDMTHRRDLGFLSHCRRFGRDLGGLGDPHPSPRVEAQGGANMCVCVCGSVCVCV